MYWCPEMVYPSRVMLTHVAIQGPASTLNFQAWTKTMPPSPDVAYRYRYFLAFLPFPPFSSSRPRFLLALELATNFTRTSFNVPRSIRFSPSRTTTACLLFSESSPTRSDARSVSSSWW